MDSLQWYDYVRLLIVGLSIASMYRLSQNIRHRTYEYSSRLWDYVFVIYVALFTLMTGTLEGVVRDVPLRYNLPLAFALALTAFRATRRSHDPLTN